MIQVYIGQVSANMTLYRVPHNCTTGWYAAITSTASIPTSTENPYSVVLAKHEIAP
jgi:hypothetical protein